MKKEKIISFRVDEDTARYIEFATSFHSCTKTEFITKQIIKPEFYELRFDEIKPLSRLMGNVANNLNQIARALNILKQDGSKKMSEEQFDIIQENIKEVRNLLGEHDEAYKKCIMKYYKVSTNRRIRTIGEMQAGDIGGENTDEDDCNGNS